VNTACAFSASHTNLGFNSRHVTDGALERPHRRSSVATSESMTEEDEDEDEDGDFDRRVRLPVVGKRQVAHQQMHQGGMGARGEVLPGPGHYRLPRHKFPGGRISESVIEGHFETLGRLSAAIPGELRVNEYAGAGEGANAVSQSDGRHDLTGPGQYELANPLPEGGRFNKHRSKTVFEMEIIPTRDIPGPGTYENLRQVMSMRVCLLI